MVRQEGYEGIVVKKENNPVGVNMDAEKLYSDLQQGKSYEDVFHYAVDVVQKGFENSKFKSKGVRNYSRTFG